MAKQVRISAEIGALLRSAHKEQNLQQDELADVSGAGVCCIVDLNAGKLLPTVQRQ